MSSADGAKPSEQSPYHLGKTASFASAADPRFSYCLYVPPRYAARPARILVAIHDTLRNNQGLRDLFADYAEQANTVVIAPLFPAAIEDLEELDNYKYLEFRGIRFDRIVLAMVDEVAKRYALDGSRFSLFGFSGGAHFTHRFLYVHPDRLDAVIAGAPGSVTLPTEDYAWWPGLKGFDGVFGHPVRWDLVRRVPIYLIVGGDDTNPRGIVASRNHPRWIEGADAAGGNRVERLRTLHARLHDRGARVTFEELAGVGHELAPIVAAAARFLQSRDAR